MERAQAKLTAIIIISMTLSLLSIFDIIRKAFREFNPFIHLTCLMGSLIILTLTVLDLLVETNSVGLLLYTDFSSIYFLGTSLTSILSCYVLIQVGSNFYQEYTYFKTILLFTPIIVSLGVFGMSVFIAVTVVLTNSDNTKENDETKFIFITFILSAVSGVLSLIYGIFPLFSIRSQTALRPQQTAVSIVHFFIVVVLFIAHFIVYTIITFNGSELDFVCNSVENMILILIFPGSLFIPPKGMVKFIKRMFLGVEQLTIGGDYRPNMLQDNETNRSTSPMITQIVVPSISNDGSDSNNDASSSSRRSLSTSSSPPSHSVSIVSNPAPEPRTSPNSASPKRNELPLVKSRSLLYPRSYIRTRLQSFPGSSFSGNPSQPQDYKQSQSENYPQLQNYPPSQNYPQNYPPSQNYPQPQNYSQPQNYKQPKSQPSQKSLKSQPSQKSLKSQPSQKSLKSQQSQTYISQQPQIPQVPQVPQIPQIPQILQKPQIPQIPQRPQISQKPQISQSPYPNPPITKTYIPQQQQIYNLPPPPSSPPPPQIYNRLPPSSSPPPQSYSYFVNPSQSIISDNSKGSSSIGSDASFYLSKFTNNNNTSSNGEGSSNSSKSNSSRSTKRHYHQPQYFDPLNE